MKFNDHFFISRLIGVCIMLFTVSLSAQQVITLEQALEISRKNSPDIRQTEYNLIRSQENLNAQKAALKSRFSLSVTPFDYKNDRTFVDLYSQWNTYESKRSYGTFAVSQPIALTDGNLSLMNTFTWSDVYSEFTDVRNESFNNNLYLQYTQPFFTYNRTKLAMRELVMDLENTKLAFAIQQLALERQVADAFYAVYRSRMSLAIAKEELENQRQSHEIIKNKVEAGLSAKEELYQAELNLATSESNVYNQEVALENGLDQFKRLIGMSLFDEIEVLTDISHQPVELNLQNALDHGIMNRMELRQRQINIESALFSLTRTKAQNEFRGDITLAYGLIGTDSEFNTMYDNPTKNQKFSLSFNIPLFDWGEKKARIKASEATIHSRELSMENEKNNIIISIRQVYRSLLNLENQIEIAEQNERNAQLTYDINLERYRNGDLTSMDLSLFQNQLSQKKLNFIQALINYKLELLNMKIQSLWDFEKQQSVVPAISK
ncbi:TolC family protein [bacterium]|nr:TolC family protein [bacterium]